jgi:N-acetylglucosamine malate deacetylase 1
LSEGPLDVLALAAHRDDVEQTCGGTLLKMAERGLRTGILDLTQGEMGTRGTSDDRAREAADAARILKATFRAALDIPDGRVENSWENRLKIARVIREQRPRVLILPYWQGRHPDHYTASTLGYEAAFLAGLRKLGNTPGSRTGATAEAVAQLAPHRPFKIIYASLYYDVRPSFVVDISDQFETRLQVPICRPECRHWPIPAGKRNPQPPGSHGQFLRFAGWREICGAVRTERSRPGGRYNRYSSVLNLKSPAPFKRNAW